MARMSPFLAYDSLATTNKFALVGNAVWPLSQVDVLVVLRFAHTIQDMDPIPVAQRVWKKITFA